MLALPLQYRARQHETDRTKMRTYRAEARDYLMMLGGVEEQRVRLSNRVKFAIDLLIRLCKKLSGKEVVDRSARLVGLEVPQTYAEKEDEELKRKTEAAAKYLAEKQAKEKASAATGS
ncbi:hypothetical protein BBJ28_00010113 [Nothophytophthora sp. Chile5]|nr:hypothetical protein BBJ28_00010113 [Nothophytophthora sp. Chile5]